MKLHRIKKAMLAAALAAAFLMGCGSAEESGNVNQIHSYDVENYVTLGDYDGMEVEVAGDYEVTDEEVIDYINLVLTYYPDYADTDKTTVEEGDFVNIDYEGKKDDVAFDGGTAQGYVLEIGSGTFIDGFEDGLIGVDVGKTVDLDLTFPENYGSEELAGADVVFTVTVNKIVEKTVLTYELLTDDYVYSNFYVEDVETLYEQTRTSLEEDCEDNREIAVRSAVLEKLVEISKIAVPDGLLEMKVDQYIQQFTNQYCDEDNTLADYLSAYYGMTEEEFEETITEEMEENLNDELALEALAKAEGHELDEEGFATYVSSAVSNGGYASEDELYAAYDSDYEDGRAYLENRYLLTSALTKLIDKCNIIYTGTDAGDVG